MEPDKPSKWHHAVVVLAVLSIGMVSLLGTVSWRRSGGWSGDSIIPSCGDSVLEAQSRGCHYDVMMGAWLPEECFDREFSESLSPLEDGRWFWDPNLTKPMSKDELARGEYVSAFSHPEFHLRHCTYMFMKLVRAYEKGWKMVDGDSMELKHREHCARLLRDPYGFDTGHPGLVAYSRVDVSFMRCARVGR
ncbi:hypothetical protein FOPE_04850 [Fonsecaea pedrosoi]|nr:hypothetical protein FOPE_04850 [Fonsecaea pedrosoi]